MVKVPMHFRLGVLDGIAQRARFFVRAARAGAVQSQANEPAIFESLVAFGLMEAAANAARVISGSMRSVQ